MNICLASGSPRRSELLRALGHNIKIIIPEVEEISDINYHDKSQVAITNARIKAEWVYNKFNLDSCDFIIAADTVVICNNIVFGKPKNSQDAELMLEQLSGQRHEVITAFCLIGKNNIKRENKVISFVSFRLLDKEEIRAYVALKECLDKAGSYAVNGAGAALIDQIEGSVTNIIGLPIREVLHEARFITSRL